MEDVIMDTMAACMLGEMTKWNESKVFDWDKAAKLIKEHNIKNAQAGLIEDWGCTCGIILDNGKIIKGDYTYLASTWATPVLTNSDSLAIYECYIMSNETQWDAHTKWTESAVKILNET